MKRVLAIFMAVAVLVALALPALAVSGTVVNKKGKPVPNAKLELYVNYSNRQEVTTNAKGEFSYSPPDGKDVGFIMQVTAPGYAYLGGYSPFKLTQKELVKLVLSPEKKVKGKVVDENGKPVAGAKVALEQFYANSGDGSHVQVDGRQFTQGQVWNEGVLQEVTTKSDGTFTLDHLPDPSEVQYFNGTYEVTADGRALITQYLRQEELGGGLLVTDPLECKLQGMVYVPDKSGPVTGGVRLAIPNSGGRVSDGRSVAVDKDGKYSFTKLPPGSYKMILSQISEQDHETKKPTGAKKSWVLPAVPLELVSGKTQTVDVNLIEGVLIKGKVVDSSSGKEIKQAELFISHNGRPEDANRLFLTTSNSEFSCYVVPGEVDISPQRVGEGADESSFYDENRRPHLTFNVNEDKTDVVFKIDPAEGERYGQRVAPKPVPADLELTAGTYDLEWDPEQQSSYHVRGKSYNGDDAKSKILKLPKLTSKKPLFYAAQFDGTSDEGFLVYAVDESGGTGKGYDTIYVDLNRNRSLADDKPIIIAKAANNRTQRSPWIEIPSHQGPVKGVHLEKPIKISFMSSAYTDAVSVNMTRKGGWRGKIDTNKGKIDCIVQDSNTNGIYGDLMTFKDDLTIDYEKMGDFLFADVTLSGRISMQPEVYMPHLLWIQKATMVAGKLYSISINPTGDKVTINNYTGQTGSLVASAEKMKEYEASITSVALIGKSGYYEIKDYDGKPVTLPAGDYKFNRCTVSIPQSTGSIMNLDCQPDLTATVKAGQESMAELGGKFAMRGIEPDKKVVYLSAGSTSAAAWFMNLGDNITITRVEGTGDYNSYSPTAKLLDKSGKVVATPRSGYT